MKIIATDYDGTLNHKGIDERKKNAIAVWRKEGNLFGVVSGRGIRSLLGVLEGKDFEYDFLIGNNGAVICDKNINILNEYRCDGDIAKPFIEDLFYWGCPFANIDKDVTIIVRADGEERDKEENEIYLQQLPQIDYFNQISTMLDTVEEAARIVLKIKEKYGEVLTPLLNGNCIDIVPAGVDKAKGIYGLLEALGASYDDVIAVGDDYNDEAMIAEFRSYAMANGVQLIKDLADDITEGITELIEKEMTSISV